MPERQDRPHSDSFDAGVGPEVFVGAPEEYVGSRGGAMGSHERTIPISLIAVIAAAGLLLGGTGGYLLGRGSHDTSVAGQVSYACVLIDNVHQTHQTPEDWGDIFEDEAYKDVSAASISRSRFLVATS